MMSRAMIWLPALEYDAMIAEAGRSAPKETGGLLLGYWADDQMTVPVITTVIGAGPQATHDEDRFVPDHDFQSQQVERASIRSGKRLWYLGDWHSHPCASSAYLSTLDKRTLRTIAEAEDAYAPRPIMIVLNGDDGWSAAGWQGGFVKQLFGMRRFRIWRVSVQTFGPA
jgi:integrative and conjugative element protein (TIGR02256 family)